VKEAIHIKTGKYYACKVINKKLMEGREHMVSIPPASDCLAAMPLGVHPALEPVLFDIMLLITLQHVSHGKISVLHDFNKDS
jgi:hypothetical protein